MTEKTIKEQIVQLLTGRAGALLAPVLSTLVSIALTWLSRLSPDLAKAIDAEALAGLLFALSMVLINAATNRWLTKDARIAQSWLNAANPEHKVETDGWIAKESLESLKEVVRKAALK